VSVAIFVCEYHNKYVEEYLVAFDKHAIGTGRRVATPVARVVLFVVFFYFGFLKVVGLSPADPLVASLLEKTLFFIPFESFSVFLGLFEMCIGILFLIPGGIVRVTFLLLVIQMSTTFLPLVMLPDMTWRSLGVPTLEGQYIIKNLVIIALALGVASRIHPLSLPRRKK